jgi:hypothetical protein
MRQPTPRVSIKLEKESYFLPLTKKEHRRWLETRVTFKGLEESIAAKAFQGYIGENPRPSLNPMMRESYIPALVEQENQETWILLNINSLSEKLDIPKSELRTHSNDIEKVLNKRLQSLKKETTKSKKPKAKAVSKTPKKKKSTSTKKAL